MKEKKICWVGSAKEDLLKFPEDVRKSAGHQLNQFQAGLYPDDWKSLSDLESGINEIRIWGIDGTYRIICAVKFEEAIYVLHCFQKKTEKMPKRDKEIVIARYKDTVINRKNK